MNLEPTPYDLRWSMFGIPVRIHPSFWLIALVFSWPYFDALGLPFLFIGVSCILLAILIHEMAHALMFALYNTRSIIFCYSFGGLTIPEARVPVRLHRILVTAAGPATNLLLAAFLWGSNRIEPWALTNEYVFVFYQIFFVINLYWGILNLLPVIPLDGGQICREIWQQVSPQTAFEGPLTVSMLVAGAIAVYAVAGYMNLIPPGFAPRWFQPGIFAAFLFGVLAVQNFFELQNRRRAHSFDDESWRG